MKKIEPNEDGSFEAWIILYRDKDGDISVGYTPDWHGQTPLSAYKAFVFDRVEDARKKIVDDHIDYLKRGGAYSYITDGNFNWAPSFCAAFGKIEPNGDISIKPDDLPSLLKMAGTKDGLTITSEEIYDGHGMRLPAFASSGPRL